MPSVVCGVSQEMLVSNDGSREHVINDHENFVFAFKGTQAVQRGTFDSCIPAARRRRAILIPDRLSPL